MHKYLEINSRLRRAKIVEHIINICIIVRHRKAALARNVCKCKCENAKANRNICMYYNISNGVVATVALAFGISYSHRMTLAWHQRRQQWAPVPFFFPLLMHTRLSNERFSPTKWYMALPLVAQRWVRVSGGFSWCKIKRIYFRSLKTQMARDCSVCVRQMPMQCKALHFRQIPIFSSVFRCFACRRLEEIKGDY